jgi:hypothetical protein
MSETEQKKISTQINKEFNILLSGHIHEKETIFQTGINGNLFVNIAPSGILNINEDSQRFRNGFSLIDLDSEAETIECLYYNFNDEKKEFVIDTDHGPSDGSKSLYQIPIKNPNTQENLIQEALQTVVEEYFEEIDDQIIGANTKGKKIPIEESFVLPPIDEGEMTQNDDENISSEVGSLNQIIKSNSNQIFFGGGETGKTTLLYRLLKEYYFQFENIRKIPIYIDLGEKNKDIKKEIKDFLRISTKTADHLIDNNLIVLLVDNLRYKDRSNNNILKLKRFNEQNDEVQIIGTGDYEFLGSIPTEFLKNINIPFKSYFIKNLRAEEIKNVMQLWVPEETKDSIKKDQRLEQLVNNFKTYALPSTAMQVSLFIWSTEYSDKKPINSAVLLEIYIEIILEKLNPMNVYRETFDFTNKLQLLANVAEYMLYNGQENYSIKYSEYYKVVEDYLENKVGFNHNPKVIIDYLFERKIFSEFENNKVKFSNSCFFHFFLAKRMQYNKSFKDFVLDEKNYYNYHKEIDYYTGLVRSDKETFNLIYDRFKNFFKQTDFILEKVDLDEFFTPQSSGNEPAAKKFDMKDVPNNRPSEKMLEEIQNRRLEKIQNPKNILKEGDDFTLEKLLKVMSNVLRNSEGVEDLQLKKDAYSDLIKYFLVYLIIYREVLLDYVIENQEIPKSFPNEFQFKKYIMNLPLFLQSGIYKQLASPKLNSVISSKIQKDLNSKNIPNLEAFLSIFLYSDLKSEGFPEHIYKFIKGLKTNKRNFISSDFTLIKLLNYFYKRTRKGSDNEDLYLDLLAELKIRTKDQPRKLKEQIKKKYYNQKNERYLSIK